MAPRNTPQQASGPKVPELNLPVAAGTLIEAGNIVALVGGYAVVAGTAAGTTVAGRAEATVDNTSGAAGAVSIRVRRGCFLLLNDGTTPVLLTDTLKTAYMSATHTVSTATGANSVKAGTIIGLNASPAGVWVEVG